MRIIIDYTSFKLSKGTEAIRWTDRAEWFFKDHNLEYEIVFLDFYNEPQVKCIQWSENLVVNIPIHTLTVLQSYSSIYNCKFIVDKDLYTIKFNEV